MSSIPSHLYASVSYRNYLFTFYAVSTPADPYRDESRVPTITVAHERTGTRHSFIHRLSLPDAPFEHRDNGGARDSTRTPLSLSTNIRIFTSFSRSASFTHRCNHPPIPAASASGAVRLSARPSAGSPRVPSLPIGKIPPPRFDRNALENRENRENRRGKRATSREHVHPY